MKDTVTEISGRGVGLDVVQNMVKSVRGTIRITTQPGRGMRFQLHLPLTLSVLRALAGRNGGRTLRHSAFPDHPHVETASAADRSAGRPPLFHPRRSTDRVAHRPPGSRSRSAASLPTSQLPVVVLGDRTTRYGLVVDRFLGERELVVQALDPRLGKVKDISAGALMEDGSPVLIVDVEDMVRSIEKLISGGRLDNVQRDVDRGHDPSAVKRILAVDDSLTVRELERKLLTSRGYVTEVAVDGMDGWNAVRTGNYDLVITDVDMPRMDGIELATLIKQDPHLKIAAGHDCFLQRPRGGSAARIGGRRGLLSDQRQLP